MRVRVKLFAALRESVDRAETAVELPAGATAGDVRAALVERHPRLRDLLHACRVARGVEFVADSEPLAEGDEVALIPPVSGGNRFPRARLTHEPLDARELREEAAAPTAGAVVVFEGTVRSPSGGRVVTHLEYEAHEPMALAQMERLLEETAAQTGVASLWLHHRLGRVEVGEASVVAVAVSPHRAEAFTACRAMIERLKADVPIWKKEYFADGSVWVGAPGECHHPPPLDDA